jgi:tetratricopeptide (TPR) repeat protein
MCPLEVIMKNLIIDGSEEFLKNLIRLKPNHLNAHCSLAAIYAQTGDYQNAIASYKEAIRIKPDLVQAHYELGRLYGKTGEHQKAITMQSR